MDPNRPHDRHTTTLIRKLRLVEATQARTMRPEKWEKLEAERRDLIEQIKAMTRWEAMTRWTQR